MSLMKSIQKHLSKLEIRISSKFDFDQTKPMNSTFVFRITFHIKALEVSGLSSFKLVSADYNPDSMQIKVFFTLPHLHVKSNFSWSSQVDFDGKMKMSHIDDMSIDAHFKLPQDKLGFSFEFTKDDVTGNLTTKNFQIYEPEIDWQKELGFLEEHHENIVTELKPLFEEMDEDFTKMYIERIQEHLNRIIVNYRNIDQIIEELYKASGDDHTGPFGDKLCVH